MSLSQQGARDPKSPVNCRLVRKAEPEAQGNRVQLELDLWAPADNIMTPTKSLNTPINPFVRDF